MVVVYFDYDPLITQARTGIGDLELPLKLAANSNVSQQRLFWTNSNVLVQQLQPDFVRTFSAKVISQKDCRQRLIDEVLLKIREATNQLTLRKAM